jgi:hypothetical protein
MKRKVAMMSLAMIAGLPHAVCAKEGGRDGPVQSNSFWNTSYMPHYGVEGSMHPLMDHLSVPAILPRRGTGNEWRLELAPPAAVSGRDDPISANDKRVGVSFRLDF